MTRHSQRSLPISSIPIIEPSFLLGILASSKPSSGIDLGHLLGEMMLSGGGRGADPMAVADASFLLQQVMK